MTKEFIMQNSERGFVIEWLKNVVPIFFSSPEYSDLRQYERDIIGVVCAAFSRFFVRRQRETAPDEKGETLIACYHFMEKLAESKDTEVINLLRDEIFENFECDDKCMGEIESNMESRTRKQFEKWK